MTSSSTTSSSRTGKGGRGKRAHVSEAQRDAADAARAARIAALHDQIGEQVEALTADPQWRAMLDAAAKFRTYSLNNQLLIELQAARLGISPTRVAGFDTWKALGRSVVKGVHRARGAGAVHLHTQEHRPQPGGTRRRDGDGDGDGAGRRGRQPACRGAGAARVPGRARLRRLPDRR